MISYLNIKNFESHKETRLNFTDGLNVIIGSSDEGKSSLIRALNLIINNEPGGLNYRSDWCSEKEEVEIELGLEEGDVIKRIRSNRENVYYLNNEKLEAFKTKTPENIEKILNCRDINFQFQGDTHFLIGNKGGEVARYLNQIVNLDIIDVTLSEIEREKRRNKSDFEYTKGELELKIKELEKYNNIPIVELKIKELEELEIRTKEIKKEEEKIVSLSKEYNSINEEIELLNNHIKNENIINDLLYLSKKIEDIKEEERKINDLTNEQINLKKRIKEDKEEIKLDTFLDGLILLSEEINNVKKEEERIVFLSTEYVNERKEIDELDSKITNMEKELNKSLKICPLCGRS